MRTYIVCLSLAVLTACHACTAKQAEAKEPKPVAAKQRMSADPRMGPIPVEVSRDGGK